MGESLDPGQMWSYCNSGWVLLGGLVETMRGEPFHKIIRERLFTPIGANASTLLMEEMLARSCAVGHLLMPGATEPVVPPNVMLPPAASPAGSLTCSTPAEVLRFVRMHLDGGRTKDGTQVLSADSAKAMQQPQVKLPESSLGVQMGLGWILSEWDGERVIGHGGGTVGQLSFLQILPDRRFAVCLLTNSSSGAALWRDLGRYPFEKFAGVHMAENPKVPDVPPDIDLAPYAGSYRRLGIDMELKVSDGKLVAVTKGTGALAELSPPQTGVCHPIDKELFLATIQGQEAVMQFIDFDTAGRPTYVHVGGRVSKRVEPKPKPKKVKTR